MGGILSCFKSLVSPIYSEKVELVQFFFFDGNNYIVYISD